MPGNPPPPVARRRRPLLLGATLVTALVAPLAVVFVPRLLDGGTAKADDSPAAEMPAVQETVQVRAGQNVHLRAGVWTVAIPGPNIRSDGQLHLASGPGPDPDATASFDGTAGVQTVDIRLDADAVPGPDGHLATITVAIPEPHRGRPGTLATYDEELAQWVAVETELSADGMTAAADVEHFSEWNVFSWGDYWVGKARSARHDAPTCDGDLPDWVDDVVHVAYDRNDPVLWCAGRDPRRPDLVVVKLTVNRSTAAFVQVNAAPEWKWHSAFDVNRVLGVVAEGVDLAEAAASELALLRMGSIPVPGGAQYHLAFTEESIRALEPGTPVVQVNPSLPQTAIAVLWGLLAGEMNANRDGAWATEATAGAMAVWLTCAGDMAQARGDAHATVTTLARCIESGWPQIEAMATRMLKSKASLVKSKAILVKAAVKRAAAVSILRDVLEIGRDVLAGPGLYEATVWPKVVRPGPPEVFDMPAVCDLPAARWHGSRHPDGTTNTSGGAGDAWVEQTVNADVTGDGDAEWVLLTLCHFGGNDHYSGVYVFSLDGDLMGRLPVEDHVPSAQDAPASDVTVEDGAIVVTATGYADGDPRCCPSIGRTVTFRWDGSAFAGTSADRPSPDSTAASPGG